MWSPDDNYLVYRAQVGTEAGHSLLALDVETGQAARLTHNQSDEHHHSAQEWIADKSRLLYTVQSIEELELPCYHLSPAQLRPEGVPHIEAHIISIPDRTSTQLQLDGYVSAYFDSGFEVAPDARHISFASVSRYGTIFGQGGCGFAGVESGRFNVYDISGESPRRIEFDPKSTYGTSWSSDGRFLSYRGSEANRRGPPTPTYSILDTRDGSVWRIPVDDVFESDARLDDVAWTPDGARLIYDVELGDIHDYWDRSHVTVVADVSAQQIVPLEIPREFEGHLRFYGFSPDGRTMAHSDTSPYGSAAGRVLVHDIASGALIGIYDMYAATEPGEPVLVGADGDNILKDFRFEVEWSPAGIFASGEYYLYFQFDF